MTFPLPWVPKGRPTVPAWEVAALRRWLVAGRTTFDTICLAVPVPPPDVWDTWDDPTPAELATTTETRRFRLWVNRHRLHAYDDATGEIVATVPNPHNVRRFTGTEVPTCSCS